MDFDQYLWLSCNKIFAHRRSGNLDNRGTESLAKAVNDKRARFAPKFDDKGLLCALAVDASSGDVLMVAYMNEEALRLTRETSIAHFWSRSRETLWKKGETSGNILEVREILVDCDQDCLILMVNARGPACHTGARSCFYRRLEGEQLVAIET